MALQASGIVRPKIHSSRDILTACPSRWMIFILPAGVRWAESFGSHESSTTSSSSSTPEKSENAAAAFVNDSPPHRVLYYSGENRVWFSLFDSSGVRCFAFVFKAFSGLFVCVSKAKRVESFSSFFVPTGRDVFFKAKVS